MGGGASGGGKAVGIGGDLIIILNASSPGLWSVSLWIVGTSERNSRSSAESGMGSLEDEGLEREEKRPRKRDTAEGAGVGASLSFPEIIPKFELESVSGCTLGPENEGTSGDTGIDFSAAGVWTGMLSTLALGDASVLMVATTGIVTGEAERLSMVCSDGILVALRPKNESKPPPAFFFPSSTVDISSLMGSKIFHPAGVISSWVMLGFALIDASHEVDPFDNRKRAIGLERVKGECRVNLNASDNCFVVNVFSNGMFIGRTRSSGTSLNLIGFLSRVPVQFILRIVDEI